MSAIAPAPPAGRSATPPPRAARRAMPTAIRTQTISDRRGVDITGHALTRAAHDGAEHNSVAAAAHQQRRRRRSPRDWPCRAARAPPQAPPSPAQRPARTALRCVRCSCRRRPRLRRLGLPSLDFDLPGPGLGCWSGEVNGVRRHRFALQACRRLQSWQGSASAAGWNMPQQPQQARCTRHSRLRIFSASDMSPSWFMSITCTSSAGHRALQASTLRDAGKDLFDTAPRRGASPDTQRARATAPNLVANRMHARTDGGQCTTEGGVPGWPRRA
jgi:hypothetical protein